MLIVERQARLQELIAQKNITDLDALAQELGVSKATVRRDVETLEKAGYVRRIHGGVMWNGNQLVPAPGPLVPNPYVFDQRMNEAMDKKRRIARKAAELVGANQTILIDGGTTTYIFAQQLVGRPMQLVTNSLPIATLFQTSPEVELILTGGVLYPRYQVLLGPMADQALASVHTSLLFMGVAGVHDGSLFNQNSLLVQTQKRMMEQAQKAILLADSSKFGQQTLSRLCDLKEIDVIVSDEGMMPGDRWEIEEAGCELILV